MLQRMPARFMRWLTSTLLAASTTPDRITPQARVTHAAPVLPEKPEFAFEILERRRCRRLVAKMADRPNDLVDTVSVVAQDSTVLVVPIGCDRMVGDIAEMFACMEEIDRPFVGLKLLKKRPVVGCGVGDSDELKIGSHFPNVGDLFRDLRFQRYLSGFRHKNTMFASDCRPRHGN